RHPGSREPDPAARLRRPDRGPHGCPAGRASPGRMGVLFVPGHGRDRALDAVRRVGRPLSPVAGHARNDALAPHALSLDDAIGSDRGSRRLVRDRDRPAAVPGLRDDAHVRGRLARARRERRHVARALRPRLRRRLRRRPVLRAEADPARTRRGRAPGSGRGGDGAQAAVGPGGHDRGSDLMEGDWLPLVWLLLIAFAIFMYVLLDGFVLGVGILFPFARSDADRDAMMMSVAPIWDGNETWLVLGVGGLLAVFPVAYAIVLPALYLPFIFMLLGLIFRGIAFEFRFKADKSKPIWDRSFQIGSIVATFFQGVVLGSFVRGFAIEGGTFVGGALDWLAPFSLLVGVALVLGYALLGSTWLIIKAPG